jgi:hypothetical protein
MRTQTMTNVVPISIAPTPNLFHHNNVRVTYAWTSNIKVELARPIPLYFVAMAHFMVIVTEAPFITNQPVLLLMWGLDHSFQGEKTLWMCIHRCL